MTAKPLGRWFKFRVKTLHACGFRELAKNILNEKLIQNFKDAHCEEGRRLINQTGKPSIVFGNFKLSANSPEEQKALKKLMLHTYSCATCSPLWRGSTYTM